MDTDLLERVGVRKLQNFDHLSIDDAMGLSDGSSKFFLGASDLKIIPVWRNRKTKEKDQPKIPNKGQGNKH